MSDLYVPIALDVYFLAGTAWLFFLPPERHIARLQARRPNWSSAICAQFFYVMRTILAAAFILLTIYLITRVREVMHR